MTAITYFFTDNGKKLTVVSDRQVTYSGELREKDKFFKKGRFYIFCAGSEDVYNQVVYEIKHNRKNIKKLADFINKKCNEIINNSRRTLGINDDYCSFIIVDTKTLKVLIVNRGSINEPPDFGIIGVGENYTQEIYEKFSILAPTGFQLRKIKWNNQLYEKIIDSYHTLAFKDSTIGHPALFKLDIFVFQKNNVKHKRLRFKYNLKTSDSFMED